MVALTWDEPDKRIFELGVDKGVFFPYGPKVPGPGNEYKTGIPWNGLVNVTEKPTGGEDNKQWADNMAYANIRSAEEFEASIEAFTYPDELAICDGTAQPSPGVFVGQQGRKPFGFAYRSKIGNNGDNIDYGYKITMVWLLTPQPSEKSRDTINDSPEAATFSWDCKGEKVKTSTLKPTATITIDSTKVDAADLVILEKALYGDATGTSRLPSPDEVLTMFA